MINEVKTMVISLLRPGFATKLERRRARSILRILYSRTSNSVTWDTRDNVKPLLKQKFSLSLTGGVSTRRSLRFHRWHYYYCFWPSHIFGVWLGAARDSESRICRFMFHAHWVKEDHIHTVGMAFAWSRELRHALTSPLHLAIWAIGGMVHFRVWGCG